MSETDLIKSLRKAVDFDGRIDFNLQMSHGAELESARLQPLWDKVIAAIETLENYACIYCVSYPNTTYPRCLGYQSCKALEQLRLAVGGEK